jgi:hypothetical protein
MVMGLWSNMLCSLAFIARLANVAKAIRLHTETFLRARDLISWFRYATIDAL